MAKRTFRLSKRRLAVIFGVGFLVGAGAYVVLDRIAQSRAEAALAKIERRLPDDARLAYTRLDASFLAQSATLDSVIFQIGSRQIRANTLTVADVGETSGGNLRAGEVTAKGITGQTVNGVRVNARTARLADLMIAPDGRTLRSLGKARVDTVSLSRGEGSVRVSDLEIRGASPRRVGRIAAGVVEMRGITAGAEDREVLRGLRVDGLDFSAVPPIPRSEGLEPARLAAIIRELTYDAVQVRKTELYRAGERRLMLRGLESRRNESDPPTRIWTSGVDEFAVRVNSPRANAAGVLDDQNMLRGNVRGRQAYDPEAGTLAFTDMSLEVRRAGRLEGEIRFAGLPEGGAGGGVMPDRASLAKAELARIDIVYADNGILDAVLSALSARSGVSREVLVERRMGALKRAVEGAPQEIRNSMAALEGFLRDGGALRLRANPDRAVPMSAALMKLTFQPVATVRALNVRVSRP